jgi:hypothetical protein
MDAQIVEGDQIAEVAGTWSAEAQVDAEITRLWSAQQDQAATARRTREELKAVKLTLAERLHQMKMLLVQTGRGGRWASYLREHGIPRATADRYVQKHELALMPPEPKRLSEAISKPTDDDVQRLFQKLLPQMRRVLVTQNAAFTFVVEMIHGLPGLDGDVLDEGAIVFRPREDSESAKSLQNGPPLQVAA